MEYATWLVSAPCDTDQSGCIPLWKVLLEDKCNILLCYISSSLKTGQDWFFTCYLNWEGWFACVEQTEIICTSGSSFQQCSKMSCGSASWCPCSVSLNVSSVSWFYLGRAPLLPVWAVGPDLMWNKLCLHSAFLWYTYVNKHSSTVLNWA